jgi:protein-S-isoprenylcysteine O-methyltransferase Ste14
MFESNFLNILLAITFPLAVVTFIALQFINAPYGRHKRAGWGPSLSNRIGWLLMESPSVFLFGTLFFIGSTPKTLPVILFFLLWEAHYIHRSLIYPFMISDGRKLMPLAVVLMAFGFNLGNAYINGRYLFSLSGGYPLHWMLTPQMIAGLCLFTSGFTINRWADRILQTLREPGETSYKIPYGGLYRWISCPNYFGEIIEWIGWAIATWSLPGLAFAIWTFANLAPRARANHRWYHQHFEDYPVERKALIPGVW